MTQVTVFLSVTLTNMKLTTLKESAWPSVSLVKITMTEKTTLTAGNVMKGPMLFQIANSALHQTKEDL